MLCSTWSLKNFQDLHNMPLSKLQLDKILTKLDSHASSPADLIITLLGSADYIDHDAVHSDIHWKTDKILESLAQSPGISVDVIYWAHSISYRLFSCMQGACA